MKQLSLVLMLIVLHACNNSQHDTPEQQIRKVLSSIEQGIEERSLSQVIDHIDDDYKDHHGRIKQDIKRYVQLQILRNQNITVFTRIKSIEIEDIYASVELSAATAARGVDLNIEANRLKADSHKASIVFKNNSEGWQITSSSWQRGW